MGASGSARSVDAAALLEAFRASPDTLVICDRAGVVVGASRALAGVPPETLAGTALADLVSASSAEPLASALRSIGETGSARADIACSVDGRTVWYAMSLAPHATEAAQVVVVASDITARREREARLERAEALMNDAQGAAHLGTWEWDPAEPHATWSAELYRIYGVTPETYTPSYEAYLTKVHPDDRAHVMAATERVFTQHEPYSHDERIFRPDGTIRYLHTWAHAIVDPRGKLERLIGVCQDITEQKLVERELAERNALLVREAEQRARVEALLRRSQKLEAIGRLTGGIAHDFNNVLGVVMGYASVLHAHLPSGSRDREDVAHIMSAVERAGRMTSQLLSFSSDHAISRGPLELDRVVSELAPLMRRLIGEEIELTLDLDEARRERGARGIVVSANGSQIEQVLMNLAVNARDAMPDGGKLTIATAHTTVTGGEVPAGEYARLSVSDDGMGMSSDVQAQVFDPFFTTKELGKGTGLGLSTVYGIVKQSGGSIAITSEPGGGTRFDILLPILERSARAAAAEVRLPTPRGTETILLVEDEAPLRGVLRHALETYGYRVLEASDAAGALQAAAEHVGPIELALTDVVMPKLSGRELVERLLVDRPRMQVLYMSGYTTDVVLRQGVIEGSVALLRKPFTADELARRLRQLLDERREQPTL
jgi:two-component system cell cycle sensor histidine kinase/response regulator CckA